MVTTRDSLGWYRPANHGRVNVEANVRRMDAGKVCNIVELNWETAFVDRKKRECTTSWVVTK